MSGGRSITNDEVHAVYMLKYSDALPYGKAGYACFDEGRERAWLDVARDRIDAAATLENYLKWVKEAT